MDREYAAAGSSSFFNKRLCINFLLATLLFLAGLGGEEEKMRNGWRLVVLGADHAFERGAGKMLLCVTAGLPRWKQLQVMSAAISLIKRFDLLLGRKTNISQSPIELQQHGEPEPQFVVTHLLFGPLRCQLQDPDDGSPHGA